MWLVLCLVSGALLGVSLRLIEVSRDLARQEKRYDSLDAVYRRVESEYVKLTLIVKDKESLVNSYSQIMTQALTAAFKEETDKYKKQVDEVNNGINATEKE